MDVYGVRARCVVTSPCPRPEPGQPFTASSKEVSSRCKNMARQQKDSLDATNKMLIIETYSYINQGEGRYEKRIWPKTRPAPPRERHVYIGLHLWCTLLVVRHKELWCSNVLDVGLSHWPPSWRLLIYKTIRPRTLKPINVSKFTQKKSMMEIW